MEAYVQQCVDKLQEQEYKNYEIILVEDGSTDNTYEVCRKLEQTHAEVTLVTHPHKEGEVRENLGQEATRNLGMQIAKGDYVLFLDADDYLNTTTLLSSYNVFSDDETVDFILGGFCYKISESGQELEVVADLDKKLYSTDELIGLFHTKLPTNLISCVGTKVYRRNFLIENNLSFDRKYRFNEDGAFALNAFRCARKVYYLNIPLYYYVQRGGSITYSYRENAYQTVGNRINLEEKLYEDKGLLEEKSFYIKNQRVELLIALLREESIFKGWKSFCKMFSEFYENDDNRCNCKEALRVEKGLKRRIRLALFCKRCRLLLYIYYKMISY